jgi:hypothetical protein
MPIENKFNYFVLREASSAGITANVRGANP